MTTHTHTHTHTCQLESHLNSIAGGITPYTVGGVCTTLPFVIRSRLLQRQQGARGIDPESHMGQTTSQEGGTDTEVWGFTDTVAAEPGTNWQREICLTLATGRFEETDKEMASTHSVLAEGCGQVQRATVPGLVLVPYHGMEWIQGAWVLDRPGGVERALPNLHTNTNTRVTFDHI